MGSHDGRGRPYPIRLSYLETGLELSSIRKLVEAGFDIKSGTMQDPRTALLAASLLAEQAADGVGSGGNTSHLAASAEWVKDVSAKAAVLLLAKKRFSDLILMSIDQLDDHRPLPSFEVDSMLAAEFRISFWNTFKLDVPYLDFVTPQKTLGGAGDLGHVYTHEA
ncbi:putative polyketide synthase [Seiridium unicorne]|uniref:Polyketide synthase n=1 Tax=Seiridium unicorne TaxID=138068 RepID=A0ABR2UR28_9PEZI